jgi:hypothetical protein
MNEQDEKRFSPPELRYHRIGGGYRREEVEAAFEELLASLLSLQEDVGRLRQEAARLEQELHARQAELEAYRARETQIDRLLREAEQALERAAATGGRPTMTARGDG